MTPDPDAAVEWKPKPEEKRGRGRPKLDARPLIPTDGQPIQRTSIPLFSRHSKVDLKDREYAEALNVRAPSLIGGVNLTWLAAAYRIDTRTARKRLAGLKPLGIGARGDEIYDFIAASSYLAPPQHNKFARWIGTLRTSDLPVQLQDTYWAAMRKRQIWEQNAGELWKTCDVIELVSEVFKTIKSNMQLWVDNLDRDGDMPEDQRAKLAQMTDSLATEIYHSLVELPMRRKTPSSLYDPEVITNMADTDHVEDDEDLIG